MSQVFRFDQPKRYISDVGISGRRRETTDFVRADERERYGRRVGASCPATVTLQLHMAAWFVSFI